MNENVDRVGAFASTLCAIHCAVCAFLPAALGALGVGFLVGHEAEWIFTLVAVAFASIALLLGWRQHRSIKVAGLLLIGILGLLASRAIEMGSGHHGHEDAAHGSAHAEAGHKDEKHAAKKAHDEHKDKTQAKSDHKGETHHDDHAKEEGDDHDDLGHMVGTFVGVIAGFILLIGHLFNLRATRASRGASHS